MSRDTVRQGKGIMLSSKGENLSCSSTNLIHVHKKTTTCIGLQAEQILSVNIQYLYFGHAFWGSFSMLLPEAPAS